jgi:hypothetical protein
VALWIRTIGVDAPSVEAWLAQNPPYDVDTSKCTIFCTNWYGRSDFKFHVYAKTDISDPDTGFNYGALQLSHKMVTWGSTPVTEGRSWCIWFYDFSAGPELWNGSYDLSNADIDGDGELDYRTPPI